MERFPDHARVAFLGDSITAAQNFVPRIVEYYRSHLPEAQVKFWNCGVSGGTASSGLLYADADVFSVDPTHVVIMLAVNDSRRGLLGQPQSERRDAALEEAFTTYAAKMRELTDLFLSRGIKVIMMTPVPYAEFCETGAPALPGGHALILRYAEEDRKIAAERSLDVIDLHARFCELYPVEPLFNADHIHPNDLGHYRIAEFILRSQGLTIDPFLPLEEATAAISEWRQVCHRVRRVYATEWMIVRNFTAPWEQKKAIVEEYLANWKPDGRAAVLETLAREFLVNKPLEPSDTAFVNRCMEELYN